MLDKDYDLSECSFDLNNKNQYLLFYDIVNEYDQWCKMEINYMQIAILNFLEEMLAKGRVYKTKKEIFINQN